MDTISKKRDTTDTDTDTDTNTNTKPLAADDSVEPSQPPPKRRLSKKIDFDFDAGRFTNVSEAQLHAWRTAYPAISLDTEKAKAVAWLVAENVCVLHLFHNWLNLNKEDAGNVDVTVRTVYG